MGIRLRRRTQEITTLAQGPEREHTKEIHFIVFLLIQNSCMASHARSYDCAVTLTVFPEIEALACPLMPRGTTLLLEGVMMVPGPLATPCMSSEPKPGMEFEILATTHNPYCAQSGVEDVRGCRQLSPVWAFMKVAVPVFRSSLTDTVTWTSSPAEMEGPKTSYQPFNSSWATATPPPKKYHG